MTIKKRLFCSNILMIAVPAVIAAFIGLLCVALLWLVLRGGGGMRLEDGEDLTRAGRDMAGQIERAMAGSPDSWTGGMDGLEAMTESGALRIVVVQNGSLAYAAGEALPADSQPARAADAVSGPEAFVSTGDRSLYRTGGVSGGDWALYLFGTKQEHLDGSLKAILALAGISHDLRSPLTSIRAYVEGLLDGVARTEESGNAENPDRGG